MKRLFSLMLLFFATLTLSAQGVHGGYRAAATTAQPEVPTRVLLILDCSNSMWDHWQSDAKIKVTQTVLLKFLDSISRQSGIEVAMRVFGHLNKEAYGTRLEVPFESHNLYKIQSKIKTLVPQGGCTINEALSHSLNDFPMSQGARNIILVITDGMDDCEGNICQVAKQVQMSGVVVQTFILGIGNGMDGDSRMNCAGRFIPVPNEELFTQTLYNVFALSEEKARVVLQVNDESGHLYDTDIPVVFYDANTHMARFTTHYGIDGKYLPDTLTVDPLVNYDVAFCTRPETIVYSRRFSSGVINRVEVTISQGNLRIGLEPTRTSLAIPDYPVVVRRQGSQEMLNIQQLGERQRYLAGFYDVEVLCVPPLRLPGIAIQENANTDLSIPTPGMMIVSKPRGLYEGSVFSEVEGRMTWLADLDGGKTSERLMLMPGRYEILLRPHGDNSYDRVVTKRFSIKAGLQTNVTF